MATRRKNAPKASLRPPKDKKSAEDPLVARLQAIVRIMEASSLSDLSYEDQDIAVTLARPAAQGTRAERTDLSASAPDREGGHSATLAPSPPPAPSSLFAAESTAGVPSTSSGPSASRSSESAEDHAHHFVRSPFVGTFYRSPSPNEPPFVEPGQHIARGQTLCIVEAMKLMNEIESEVEGTIVEVLVENAKAVQYGDALFKIAKGK